VSPTSFLHSVASGDPTTDGIVLWTRVTPDGDRPPDALTTRWEVRDASTGRVVARGATDAVPDQDWTVKVIADGLEAGTAYEYQFAVGDLASPLGRFRTLPTDASQVQLGVFACTKYNAGYFNAYRGLAARDDLQFLICLGDSIYEASNTPPPSQTPGADIGRDFSPLHECYTLADYRQRYAQIRTDPDAQAMHRSHAVVSTIDDHELADNAWAGGSDTHDPGTNGPWGDRKRAALRAWEEWTPTRVRPGTRDEPIYRRVDVGSLLTLMLLESRTHRSAPTETDPAKRTEFGPDQLEWMRRTAAGATNPWLLAGVPSTVSPLWSPALDEDASFALRKLKLVEPKDGTPFHDLWDSFPGERRALEEVLLSTPATPVILSGDVHVGIESELRNDDAQLIAHEWTTSSVTSQNLDDKMGWPARGRSVPYEDQVRQALPHIRWCDFDSHGYMIVTVEPARATCEWWAVATVLSPTDAQRSNHTSSVTLRS
jgi:alkaline phosphatase D